MKKKLHYIGHFLSNHNNVSDLGVFTRILKIVLIFYVIECYVRVLELDIMNTSVMLL